LIKNITLNIEYENGVPVFLNKFRNFFKKKLYLRGLIQKQFIIMKDLFRCITIDKNFCNDKQSN